MTLPIRPTIGCRDWSTFLIQGYENPENVKGAEKYLLPTEVLEWLLAETSNQWAWEGREQRVRVYVQDEREAALFSLAWWDHAPK